MLYLLYETSKNSAKLILIIIIILTIAQFKKNLYLWQKIHKQKPPGKLPLEDVY